MPKNDDAGNDAAPPPNGTGAPDNQPTIETVQKQLSTVKSDLDSTRNELAAKDDQLVALQTQYDDMSEKEKEYRKRFTGSQGAYTRDQQKWKETEERNKEITDSMASLTETNQSLQAQFDEANEKLETATTEAEIAKLGLQRMDIVFKEFPGLVPWEIDGLLPDGTGDDLRESLKKYVDRLEKAGVENVLTDLVGSSPTPPDGDNADTADALMAGVTSALTAGDQEAYDKAYDLYLQKTKTSKE